MTNRIAFGLIVIVIGFFGLDHFILQWDAPVFLMRKFVDFIDLLAFWR